MIPRLTAILAACRYFERRFEWETPLDHDVVEECRGEALRLAQRPEDEPAALFFAFSRHRAFVADVYMVIPIVLCRNHAAALGYQLKATKFALVDMAHEVLSGLHTFEDVRIRFMPDCEPSTHESHRGRAAPRPDWA